VALAATAACSAATSGYRAGHYGDTIAATNADAGLRAFNRDRARQIRGTFNASNCAECHALPATGGTQTLRTDFVIKQNSPGGAVTFDRYEVAHGHAMFRYPQGRYYLRKPPPLYGLGLLEAVPLAELQAIAQQQARESPQHRGRLAMLSRTVVGRFGWKAHFPTLRAFTATAFVIELGVHKPADVGLVTRFLRSLAAPPVAVPVHDVSDGRRLFQSIGCADCHRPSVRIGTFEPQPALSNAAIDAYTDLLLHDMGRSNAELPEGVASATEFRTPPLWGVGRTAPYMHNGRARTLSDAITMHAGQAADSAARFRLLTHAERAALVEFLRSL
jgi:CxxC motif-containing protein (DUF1111 family)